MIIFCVLHSILHTYIRFKSGSVVAASILHGTINALFGLPLIMIRGGNDLINGATGLSGFLATLVVILLILFYHGKIRKQPVAGSFKQTRI